MTDPIRHRPARRQFVAAGNQTRFDFDFQVFEADDLEVWVGAERQVEGFSVAGVSSPRGGYVSFRQAPAAGALVTLRRRMDLERTTTLPPGLPHAAALNLELDRLAAGLQQVADDVTQAATRAPTSQDTADLTLPPPAPRRALMWNAAGTGLTNGTVDMDEAVGRIDAQAAAVTEAAGRAAASAVASERSRKAVAQVEQGIRDAADAAARDIASAADRAELAASNARALVDDAANPRRAYRVLRLLNIW